MKVYVEPAPKAFVPFNLVVEIQEQRELDLLHGLLNKLDLEVREGGLYAGIITQFRNALPPRQR